jgi:demethylmenaquinone methyltransferase / 2-methoxy-6-polyprenyl-1,4-benzoquinol methylase
MLPAPRLPSSPGVAVPTPGSPEKAAVRSMFDRIARRYDLLNHLLSVGTDVRWRRACVDLLDLDRPARVFDLCTGTADVLVEALRRDRGHRGVGVDLSEQMLRRGAAKLSRRDLAGRAALAAGDAEALPLASGCFDAATIGFGIRNVGNPAAALAEIRRVLRPGGRLVVLEFSRPRGWLGAVYRRYFRGVLPRIGALVSGDSAAYSYLPASVERFPAPEAFAALMEQAGFTAVRWRLLSGGIACLHRGERP